MNIIHKYIDLNDLPRNNLGKINWKKSVGMSVYFEYDDIKGNIKILEYVKGKKNKLKIQYKNDIIYITPGHLTEVCLGKLLNKKTSEFKLNVNDVLKDNNRDLIILDKEVRIKNKKKCKEKQKWYKYHCNKCGYENWKIESSLLKHKQGCPVCVNQIVVPGMNDIPTTDPWMIKYFQGGYEEAKLYTCNSGKEIYPICPDCGRIRTKPVIIAKLSRYRSISCPCGDGISYPEKFTFNILEQLNVEFIFQLTKKEFDWCDKYKYDFYIPSINCIIETHGEQHYFHSGFKRTLEEEQENDKDKIKLALKNNISNYIVIDCRNSNSNWIKSSILNSELNNIFNLNDIDWDKADEFATNNLVKEICNFYNLNKNLSQKDICYKFKISHGTLVKYLKKGNELGWCKYERYEKERKPIRVIETGDVFESIRECEREFENKYGIKLHRANIISVLKGRYQQYKGFHFEYIDKDE